MKMNKLAVIIGRFQTPYLHKGHLKLIEEAKSISNAILILIGCTDAVGTDKNPMDYNTRWTLLYESGVLSNPMILRLDDCPSDKDWSDRIDRMINDLGYAEAYDDYKYLAHAALEAAEKVRLEEVHRRAFKESL